MLGQRRWAVVAGLLTAFLCGWVAVSTISSMTWASRAAAGGGFATISHEMGTHQRGSSTETADGLVQRMANATDPVLRAAAARLWAQERRRCDYAKARGQASWRDGRRRDIAMCLQIRNDAEILDDYIAFHWTQGVAKFIIYDDSSEDDDPWSVLEKYAALGIVEFHDMAGHPDAGMNELQVNNLNACFAQLQSRHEELGIKWVLFPDVDEFYLAGPTPSKGSEDLSASEAKEKWRTLSETLEARYAKEPCLSLARTFFGSAFHHRRPSQGLVIENYLLSGQDFADIFPKVAANLGFQGPASRTVTQLESVHNFINETWVNCRWDAEDVRIHHYVRSLEDYERKLKTGHTPLRRYQDPLLLWWERDENDRINTLALPFVCPVRSLMAEVHELMREPGVTRPPRPRPWNATQA